MNEATNPNNNDLHAYAKGSPEERLRILHEAWLSASTDRQRSFFVGQMIAVTVDMDKHPEWFEHGCLCAMCRSETE